MIAIYHSNRRAWFPRSILLWGWCGAEARGRSNSRVAQAVAADNSPRRLFRKTPASLKRLLVFAGHRERGLLRGHRRWLWLYPRSQVPNRASCSVLTRLSRFSKIEPVVWVCSQLRSSHAPYPPVSPPPHARSRARSPIPPSRQGGQKRLCTVYGSTWPLR